MVLVMILFSMCLKNKTMAQLTTTEKSEISHRGNAIKKLNAYLESEKMTKWLIVSDNHTESGILYHLYEVHKDADVLLHLGDSEFEYNDTELSLYRRVKGNCDFYPEFPNEEEVEIKGIKAIYTHGHLYSVNQTRMHLAQKLNLRDVNLHFMVILMLQNMSI